MNAFTHPDSASFNISEDGETLWLNLREDAGVNIYVNVAHLPDATALHAALAALVAKLASKPLPETAATS